MEQEVGLEAMVLTMSCESEKQKGLVHETRLPCHLSDIEDCAAEAGIPGLLNPVTIRGHGPEHPGEVIQGTV